MYSHVYIIPVMIILSFLQLLHSIETLVTINFIDPTYSPRFQEFLNELQDRWEQLAEYIGYTPQEIAKWHSQSGSTSAVMAFFEAWEVPDCGEMNQDIIRKLAKSMEVPYKPTKPPLFTGGQ